MPAWVSPQFRHTFICSAMRVRSEADPPFEVSAPDTSYFRSSGRQRGFPDWGQRRAAPPVHAPVAMLPA